MKFFAFLAIYTAAVFGTPIPEDQHQNGLNGWYIPRVNGSFEWMSLKEADIYVNQLLEKRRVTTNPVRFFLYTRSNPDKGQKIIATSTSIEESYFNPKKPTRFTIHGWTSNVQDYINKGVRKAWLEHEDCNMIAVDWSRARSIEYASSVLAVPGVGRKIAALIDFLVQTYHIKLTTVELIGHSLGAHIAGYAGKYIQSGKVHVIYGLDPALPLYNYSKPESRLSSSDAHYVESIHTNGGKLGFLKPIGTGAFYPNGGKSQPGCGVDLTGSCAHSRAVSYYVEAIERDNFASLKCDNYEEAVSLSCASSYTNVRMGSKNNALKSINGEYLVPVRETSPFGVLS